jgi:hypothetical protein
MHLSTLARDCLHSGLSGALAAGVFGAAMAGALLSTGPAAMPAAARQAAPASATCFSTATPTLSASPSSGPAGTVVRVTGKGWAPSTKENGLPGLDFTKGSPVSGGNAKISSTGVLRGTIKVSKTDTVGANKIEALEEYSSGTKTCQTEAFAPFTVTKS